MADLDDQITAVEGLWQRALGELQLQMTRATFDTWLRGTHVVAADADAWTVAVRHAYALDWLNHRLMPVIQRTADRIAGRPMIIQFMVKPSPGPQKKQQESLADLDETVIEAVEERRVTVRADGSALVWTDFYIKLKLAFRRMALRRLRGAQLSIWICLALHQDRDGISAPGVETIMEETGYNSRTTVCSGLDDLVRLRLVEKLSPNRWGCDRYRVVGYAWFGRDPAPSLFELEEDESPETGL